MMRRLGAAAVLLVLPALLAPAGLPGAGRAQAEDAQAALVGTEHDG